jgi:hypothetical protein
MVEPSPEMRPVFASTIIREDSEDYVIVSLNPGEDITSVQSQLTPFVSITYDYNEISLVLRLNQWLSIKEKVSEFKEEGPYRLITFDIVLDLSLVGYLSVVSTLMAENGVSVYALSTFLRDHILVKKEDAEKAVRLLNDLVNRYKSTN